MPILRAQDIDEDQDLFCDVVVVGSGAGGAVAAHELAAAGHDVVLLERGGYHITSEFKSDPQWSFDHLYAQRGITAALGIPPVLIPYGECVGGTTVINSGTVFRLPQKKAEQWRTELGIQDLGDENLDRYFAYIEDKIGARESVWPALGEYNRVIETGVQELGLSGAPLVRNAPHCAGCGVCVFGCPTGAKKSMLVTFIPAADALGVRIFAETRVDRIHVENGKATGVSGVIVEKETGKVRGRIRVRAKVTMLAGGAFGTPVLLQDNRVATDSGQVGRNLWIHPAAGAGGLMTRDINAWRAIPQGYKVDEWYEELGILLEGGFGPPEVVSLMVPGFGAALQNRMAYYKRMVTFGLIVEDRDSVGSVRSLRGRPPLIRYRLGQDDKRRLVFGWKKVMEILFAAGATEVYPAIQGYDVMTSPEHIARVDENTVPSDALNLTAYHPMGTCRMGEDPRTSVVNSYLETHDVSGLFITDASVFPSALGVNPQATIMAFAARTAAYVHANKDRYFGA